MSYFSGTPWQLPNGANLWFGDAVPSGDSVIQTQFMLGDFLWITLNTVGQPLMYKCTTAPSSANKDGVWTVVSSSSTIKAVSAAYAATATDDLIIQSDASPVAVTLPAASPANIGKSYTVKNNNGSTTNTVVVAGSGAIDGGHTVTLGAAYSSVTLRSDGTQYWVVSSFSTVTVA
jgi:hypothetical protein